MTPAELKCFKCAYFTAIETVSEEEGFFKYICIAYPDGIPEDIRCWKTKNPSVKPRAHTSVQDDQVGDFVFEEKPLSKDSDLTEENILDYQIYDMTDLVGPFVNTADLEQFRKYLFKLGEYPALKELIEKGASVITQELMDDVFLIKNKNENIQKTITSLQKLIEKADTAVIISTGE